MIVWIAADGDGRKWCYSQQPKRDEEVKRWYYGLVSCIDVDELDYEPINNLTWDDEPIKMIISNLKIEEYLIIESNEIQYHANNPSEIQKYPK